METLMKNLHLFIPQCFGFDETLNQEVQSASAESRTLVEMQDECRDIRLVKDWMENDTRLEYSKVTAENYTVKSFWAQWSRMVLKDDLLCRMMEVEESNNTTYQIEIVLTTKIYLATDA